MRRILYLSSIVAHFFIAIFLENSYIVSMKNRDKNEQIVREASAYCKVVCPNLKRISDKKLSELVNDITLYNEQGADFLIADAIKAMN